MRLVLRGHGAGAAVCACVRACVCVIAGQHMSSWVGFCFEGARVGGVCYFNAACSHRDLGAGPCRNPQALAQNQDDVTWNLFAKMQHTTSRIGAFCRRIMAMLLAACSLAFAPAVSSVRVKICDEAETT